MTDPSVLNLRALGFCGIDDSVSPEFAQLLSHRFPFIEWGMLFRPDLEGTPRYATMDWVRRLSEVNGRMAGGSMKLAGHLCGSRCQQVLDGDASFVKELYSLGFKRVQVNATAANAVHLEPSVVDRFAANLLKCMKEVPEVEWMIQRNEETALLWRALLANHVAPPPRNMSFLFDASCGLGIYAGDQGFPAYQTDPHVPSGYAGGMGPSNIAEVMQKLVDVTATTNASGEVSYWPVWVDMESSLRDTVSDKQTPARDVFSMNKCFECASTAARVASLPVNI